MCFFTPPQAARPPSPTAKDGTVNDPLISVIVPVYQMESYLAECVDSILAQSYPHFQLLLIDDGSTDRSGAMCDEYAARDSRIQVIHQPNKGLSGARNTGLAHAGGEYIAHIDADDSVEKDYLETLLELCLRHGVSISCCNHLICHEGGRQKTRFPAEGEEKLLTRQEACEGVLYHGIPDVSTWGKLMHRSVCEGLTYPEGRVYEDSARIAETLLRTDRIAFTPRPLYRYRIRRDSISRAVFNESKMDFITAVEHMTGLLETAYPELAPGCLRRRTHALLSVRRYFVDCPNELKPRRRELEAAVRKDGPSVLKDPKAPIRDKIAILAVLCGPWVYDALWKLLSRF